MSLLRGSGSFIYRAESVAHGDPKLLHEVVIEEHASCESNSATDGLLVEPVPDEKSPQKARDQPLISACLTMGAGIGGLNSSDGLAWGFSWLGDSYY